MINIGFYVPLFSIAVSVIYIASVNEKRSFRLSLSFDFISYSHDFLTDYAATF